jgi:hypothetical protein
MTGAAQYLLDTDVLVASKRIHYHPNFCQLFWDWIDVGHRSAAFYSIDKVKSELLGGNEEDLLHEWCRRPNLKNFFLPTKSAAPTWSELARWAQSRLPAYKPAALAKFLAVKSADAWLVAYAATNRGFVIVTNEVPAPQSQRDIKLPDAAAALGVPTISLPQLLRKHAKSNFAYSA